MSGAKRPRSNYIQRFFIIRFLRNVFRSSAHCKKTQDTLCTSVTEDKTFTHMSGKTQTREAFFGEIEDGTLNNFQYKIEDPLVRFTGDNTCLTSTTTLAARGCGFSGSWPLRTEAWFQRIGGEWIYWNKPNI